jgi:PAS domain S-box-containing protein
MFQTANLNNAPQEDLSRISRQLGDLETMLRAQHDMLRQREMELPSGTLEKLYYARSDLEALTQQLADESTELDQLRALATTTELLNSSLDPDEVLIEVIDRAIALTGAERGYIMLRSAQTGEMQFRIARDLNRQTLDANSLTVSRTIMSEAAETRRPVIAHDALADPKYDAQKSIMLHAPRSIICVPLVFKEQVTGVLYADNRHMPDLFGERETSLLMAFANQAAIAIENARLYDRVRRALVEITEIKELMDNVLASIASGVITTDYNSNIITYNPAAERILGVPYDQALGQPLQTVLPNVFEGFAEMTQTVQSKNRQQVIELEPLLPGRGPVNLTLKLTPLQDARGLTYGMAIVVDDLTEIKKRDATLSVVRTYLPPSLVRNIIDIDSLGLSGDEREVSVLFADVRGFTTYSEELDPQELMLVISQYLTVSSDAIELYDGIIDKYMGDAVVGLFNTQLNPQEDHAVRAVRAALSMAYDVKALHEVLPEDQCLFYGIGVDTGTAIIGNVGSPSRKEFTAIGEPVNFAKLLQENAQRGEVIISENTYELVKDLFAVEPLEPRKVAGYTNFRVMYRVTDILRRET